MCRLIALLSVGGAVARVSMNVWNSKRRLLEHNLLVSEDSRDRRGLSIEEILNVVCVE